MAWEDKVEYQLAKIDEKVDAIGVVVEEKFEQGADFVETPAVEAVTSVVNLAAGGALAYLGNKNFSKNKSFLSNVAAASAMVLGGVAVAASTAKLCVAAVKLKEERDDKVLEERIRAEIIDAKNNAE